MNFDFIGRKKIWFSISGVIIAAGVIAFFFKGMNFGIEFKGGTIFDFKLKREISVGEARRVMRQFNLEKSIIQLVGKREILIRTPSLSREKQVLIRKVFNQEVGIEEIKYIQNVGPGWGAQITRAASLALIISLVSILVYISFRFEFKMAVTAIVALFHDLLITIGIYALVGREVTPSTVAAILTILGYSLYDTIVVFHRIRENAKQLGKRTYSMMVNDSINQVLMRSINTSLTTLLPVVSLLLIGGETLKDFAFALFVGLISGAYSSIFTASPLLALWKETEPYYKSLKKKYGKINAKN